MVSKGEYKLLRQIQGRSAFAQVSVSVESTTTDGPDVGRANSVTSFPDWIDAALASCIRCLEILRAEGTANPTTRLVVTGVIGTHVDTTVDAIEAAAVLAVAHAFDLLDEFVLQHDGRWHVDWPAKQVRII